MLEQAPKLRLVHASGAGYDSIAIEALRENVPLCNVFHLERSMAILTPHGSGWTERVVALRFRDIAANIDRLVAGEPLCNVVHPLTGKIFSS